MTSLAAMALAAAGLSGCAGGNLPQTPAVSSYTYRLTSGDKIKLTVYGDSAISGEYGVSGEGVVSLPLAGDVVARGLTLSQFRAAVEDRLGHAFMRNPHVAAEIVNFRSVYILGDVTTPGEFPFAEGMTVYALAAKAGGFTYRANRHLVFIRHAGEAVETRYRLTSGSAVQPGDTVRIGQRVF